MDKKKVAVVGAGHLGKIHAKLLNSIEGVQPFVVEPQVESRRKIESELAIPCFESVSDIGQKLDGAIVVTPTATHFEVAAELIEAGCHLFVEKPICADVESSRELCELAERNGRILQVGHVERFNPAFIAAKPLLKDAKMIECTRHTPYVFRATDVSVVQDLMIHDIDLVLSTIKSEVTNVSAVGTRLIGPHWDSAVAWLEFANGGRACMRASRVSNHPNRSMQCLLENGHVSVDFAAQNVESMNPVEGIQSKLRQLSPEQQASAREEMFEKWLPVSQVEVVPQNAILEEQKEFIACLKEEAFPTVSGRDGLAAVEIAERVLQSMETESSEHIKRAA